jgi:hypothetical protein
MLYHALPVPDRHQTQLAYKLKYFPRRALNPNACKFIWHTIHIAYTKAGLLEHLNSERTKLYFRGQEVPIVWEYNNIPTVQEWDKYPDTDFIAVEYRKTALVEGKYVAILSFSTRPNTH